MKKLNLIFFLILAPSTLFAARLPVAAAAAAAAAPVVAIWQPYSYNNNIIYLAHLIKQPVFAATAVDETPRPLIAARDSNTWNLHTPIINTHVILFGPLNLPAESSCEDLVTLDGLLNNPDNLPEKPGLTHEQLAAHVAATGKKRYVFGKEISPFLAQEEDAKSLTSEDERTALRKSLEFESAQGKKEFDRICEFFKTLNESAK